MIVNYRVPFGISFGVFFISLMVIMFLSPELTAGLTKLSWIPDELDPEQLEKAKERLEKCDISESEFNRIDEVLFEIDKEFYLNNDTVKAEGLFKTVKGDIIACVFKAQGGTLFIETIPGQIFTVVVMGSGIVGTIFAALGFKKHGRDFL